MIMQILPPTEAIVVTTPRGQCAAELLVHLPGGEEPAFELRRSRIDEKIDPFPSRQSSMAVLTINSLWSATWRICSAWARKASVLV